MKITDLADEYGISETEMREACDTLGVVVDDDGELDEAGFRAEIDKRRASRAATTATPAPAPAAAPTPAVDEEPVPTHAFRVTPALLAGLALAAAFFMPLVSGFGGLLTVSSWGYLRLAADFHDEFNAGDWAVLGFLGLVGVLAIATIVTEAIGKRNRILLIATALDVLGLIVYIAIKVGSLDDFRHADIAGYIGVAAALVLLLTGLGVFDRGPREFRGMVYALGALLVVAGVAVPAGTTSFKNDINSMFEGIESSFDDAAGAAQDASSDEGDGDVSLDSFELATTVEDLLSEDHGIDAVVDCEDGLDAEVGATTTCTFETFDSPDQYDVDVTVTSVESDHLELELDPATQPN